MTFKNVQMGMDRLRGYQPFLEAEKVSYLVLASPVLWVSHEICNVLGYPALVSSSGAALVEVNMLMNSLLCAPAVVFILLASRPLDLDPESTSLIAGEGTQPRWQSPVLCPL